MNEIETLNSQAETSDGKDLHSIVDQMGQAITTTEKKLRIIVYIIL